MLRQRDAFHMSLPVILLLSLLNYTPLFTPLVTPVAHERHPIHSIRLPSRAYLSSPWSSSGSRPTCACLPSSALSTVSGVVLFRFEPLEPDLGLFSSASPKRCLSRANADNLKVVLLVRVTSTLAARRCVS